MPRKIEDLSIPDEIHLRVCWSMGSQTPLKLARELDVDPDELLEWAKGKARHHPVAVAALRKLLEAAKPIPKRKRKAPPEAPPN